MIIHYDSGNESTIQCSSDTSHEDTPVAQYRIASSESDISEDSLDMVEEIIYESSYDYDLADCWEDSVSFGGAQHNLNMETAPKDENTPLPSSFLFKGILGCAGDSCGALGVRPEDQDYGAVVVEDY